MVSKMRGKRTERELDRAAGEMEIQHRPLGFEDAGTIEQERLGCYQNLNHADMLTHRCIFRA